MTIIEDQVHVTLSRRNLRQLNHLLESTDGGHTCLVRKDGSGVLLVVHVEDDADHYGHEDSRERVAGSVM